jgi:two-component system phosphate regulon response regulator PhoB
MARILVIEDEEDLRAVLEYNLCQAGHEVVLRASGQGGLKAVRERRPDLILLDVMLPDISGTEVCKALKRAPETATIPIIMASARGEEIDRVLGFELGADDYVVKPYSLRELLLRISRVLSRTSDAPAPSQGTIEFGVLRLDRDAHRTWVNGVEMELTALEFKLLMTLYERKNRVQTRATLLDDVWGIKADVTTRTVDTHVKRLREKLGCAGDYVETVRGVGYRFADSPDGPSPESDQAPSTASPDRTSDAPDSRESSAAAFF